MSISSPTTDERRPWVGRNSVGRIYAAASRISCGLIPNSSSQHSQGNPTESIIMDDKPSFGTSTILQNVAIDQIQVQEPFYVEGSSNTAVHAHLSTEAIPVPASPDMQEIVPATIDGQLIGTHNVAETVYHPEPAIEVMIPQPPPPPPPMIAPMMAPIPRVPICIICRDTKETEGTKFPYNCKKCLSSEICLSCLKEWFLDACKNEFKMPAKCACSPIPVSCMDQVLSPEQIEVYKAKYEESQTTNRLYCPVPTCSTFIPPRLFVAPKRTAEEAIILQLPQITQLDNQTAQDPSFVLSMSLTEPVARKSCVSCPGCKASVCTKCHALEHIGECSGDLDPELAELLRKWRIKRCPKCRTGVRKVYGCSHVECRCGAHFCWQCLKPYSQCDQTCPDEDDDDESLEEDDLDGQAGFYEGDDHDFGDEPDQGIVEIWSCRHAYRLMDMKKLVGALEPEAELQCGHCFRGFSGMAPAVEGRAENREETKDADGDSQMLDTSVNTSTEKGGSSSPSEDLATSDKWRCHSAHLFCMNCNKDPSPARPVDATFLYKCNCGEVCAKCTEQVTEKWPAVLKERKEKIEREADLAWECYCGSIICGSCKLFVDVQMESENQV